MAFPGKGLRVRYCENLGKYERGKSMKLVAAPGDGWYVQVWIGRHWHSLLDLRFAREQDALRAAQSLIAAGLASHHALSKADPLTVKAIAVEFLQW